jgi:hypothetical protein
VLLMPKGMLWILGLANPLAQDQVNQHLLLLLVLLLLLLLTSDTGQARPN